MVACISTVTKRASEYFLCVWKLWYGRTSPRVYLWVHLSYDSKPAVFERFLSEQGFRREPKTGDITVCQYTLTQAARHAVSQSFSAPTCSSLSDPGPSQPSR